MFLRPSRCNARLAWLFVGLLLLASSLPAQPSRPGPPPSPANPALPADPEAIRREYGALKSPEVGFAKYLELRQRQIFAASELKRNPALGIAPDAPIARGATSHVTVCGNGDFNPGINLTQWSAVDGTILMGGTYFSNGGVQSGAISSPAAHQTVVGPGGFDPLLGGTIIPLSPPGGSRSVRIGNSHSGGACEALVKTFVVQPGDAYLSFWYAVVLNDPNDSHVGNTKPSFSVRVWAENPQHSFLFPWLPLHGRVDLGHGSAQIFADQFNPILQMKSSPEGILVYRTWSCAQIDLSGLVGKKIKVEFIAADCSAGAHFGYAYIGNVCGSCFGDTAGSIDYDTRSSQPCGARGKLCFKYTLPHKPGLSNHGTTAVTLAILQNGVQVATLTSGTLNSGDTYCFNIDPATIPGLNLSLGGFDFKATGTFAYQNFIPSPKWIGHLPDGVTPGQNNDYIFKCPQHACCAGTNLIVNGDFEAAAVGQSKPPVWPGIGTQYGAATQVAAGSVTPGQFHIVNGAGAAAINPAWNVVDQFTCDAQTGRFMIVNGLTGQPAGTKRTVWKQTVPVVPGRAYRFCANARHLPISHISIQPKLEARITAPNNALVATIPSTPLVISPQACNWQSLSTTFTAGPAVTAVTIDLRVDESGQGNGNDFALDDFSLQEMPVVNPALLAVTFATTTPVNGVYQIKAFYPPTLPSQPYGYVWKVSEIRPPDFTVVPNTTVFNPPQWWTYAGPTPPGQFNHFNGYQGTATLSGLPNPTTPGVFREGRWYRVTFGVWSDCEAPAVASWDFHKMPGPRPPEPRPVPNVRPADLEFDFPLLRPSLHPSPRTGGPLPPTARQAASLPRAEDDRSVAIASAKPSVSPGDRAPDFTATDARGTRWRLSELRGKKNVLLTFFPKCFTGGCATHLASLRDEQAALAATDTQVLAVSVDPADGEQGQRAFADRWQLTFPLIPDTDRRLGKLFGAVREDHQLAARMSILIDKEGIVRFVDTNVNVSTHGADVVARIRALSKRH